MSSSLFEGWVDSASEAMPVPIARKTDYNIRMMALTVVRQMAKGKSFEYALREVLHNDVREALDRRCVRARVLKYLEPRVID